VTSAACSSSLNGKELSYNNLLDLDAAVELIDDLATIPACPSRSSNTTMPVARPYAPQLKEAWDAALAGDPVSAFGGVLITTATIDKATAEAIDSLFFEIIAAPDYEAEALEVLMKKKNRMILKRKPMAARRA
jgi:phosphoribosylaminoimidazolecarboxamide formyltransferase/IMP cyclohydrolase